MSRLRTVLCRALRAHFAARPAAAGSAFVTFHIFNLLTLNRFNRSTIQRVIAFLALLLAYAPSLRAQNGPFDFGDAPAPYPTLLSADGARHQIVQGIYLGSGVTPESDGQPDPNADLDQLDDGVTFSPLVRGNVASVRVVA